MEESAYRTPDGVAVPAVTTAEMRAVDRVAVEDVGLAVVRMMEHAGRALAAEVLAARDGAPVTVYAGAGGNGGGGLAGARHLRNRDVDVTVVLARPVDEYPGAAARQLDVLRADGLEPVADRVPEQTGLAVDAVLGYGLEGAPRDRAADMVAAADGGDAVVSLDVPSGVDATSGDRPGVAVAPDRLVTLALPKTGLAAVAADLVLADIGIPDAVYDEVGLAHEPPFGDRFRVPLEPA